MGIEPRAAGLEASMLPLCYAALHSNVKLLTVAWMFQRRVRDRGGHEPGRVQRHPGVLPVGLDPLSPAHIYRRAPRGLRLLSPAFQRFDHQVSQPGEL